MAIYVTGDTHGIRQFDPSSKDWFLHRLGPDAFPEQKDLGKEDYLVICGDFCGILDTDRQKMRESSDEKKAMDWLEERPFTTLFVPGNHENYDRLTGCKDERFLNSWFFSEMPPEEKEKLRQGYPRKLWHGGFVREIRPSVLMLESGEIFEINGMHCFAFGGGRTRERPDGILDPLDYRDEKAFLEDCASKRDEQFQIRGVSWWAEEIPSREEMERGRENLRSFMMDHDRMDFIFTHDAPTSDKLDLGFDRSVINELNHYLESVKDELPYGKWFYAHLHFSRRVFENDYLLYKEILRIH